ncbi:outer membrane protein transport protein [bacterium]|nr:outer membrane protein transport protein [candidate division CSSED10-310 bacterium]
MRTLIVTSSFLFITIIAISTSLGAGFSIYEQGATAMGMAGAFSAKADDPTAIFYNPAGIGKLEGTNISLGLTAIPPKSTMEDPYGREWDTEDQLFLVPNLYITHELNEKMSLGLGVFAPYGLGMDWGKDNDWIYRYLIRDVTIETFYVSPVFAYNLNDNWSIAAGALWVKSNVEYNASVDMSAVSEALSAAFGTTIVLPDSEMKLEGDNESGDWGYNFGIHGIIEKLHLGLSYRSAVECAYDGDATFDVPASGYGSSVDSIVNGYFPDTKGLTTIEMPQSISLGIGYDVTEKLYTEFDVVWMGWSSYDSLDIDFEFAGLPDVSQRKDWDDVMSYRLGMTYAATEQLSLYGGVYFDESPIPDDTLDPILPGADRYSFQMGAGYDFGNFAIQGYYMYLQFEDRETTTNYRGINGDYESNAHMFGMQATYSF